MIITDSENNDLCLVIKKEDRSKGVNILDFYSNKEHPLQVGMWNKYGTRKELRTHKHNHTQIRSVLGFNELFYVESGGVLIYVYDSKNQPVRKVHLQAGDMLVQLSGGHGFDVLEEDTIVLEVKNGPYSDKATDKTIIDLPKW